MANKKCTVTLEVKVPVELDLVIEYPEDDPTQFTVDSVDGGEFDISRVTPFQVDCELDDQGLLDQVVNQIVE